MATQAGLSHLAEVLDNGGAICFSLGHRDNMHTPRGCACSIWYCGWCSATYQLEFLHQGPPPTLLSPGVLSRMYGAHDLQWFVGSVVESSQETTASVREEVVLRRSTRTIYLNKRYFSGEFVVNFNFGWLTTS
ncbi:unnamed protein product [Cuscuta europaea]|uniref:Uncharacterized protein n=1 Tax=Cuscuta europaea TaxID=41803 RepID=A0A9P0Z402_CUSEU|nr:unnamed protein product [Cuscuta europaea]